MKKVFVANRGEIAVRIIKGCKELGLRTATVYSQADKNAPHVNMADEAYGIGPAVPQKSYLNIEANLDALKKSKAEAVHPGYGFLSENSAFARAVEDIGVKWIGPSPSVMEKIDSKSYCRQVAEQTMVPCIPGTSSKISNVKDIRKCFSQVGSPLMIKLDRGGGGKGIEVVEESATDEALEKKLLSIQSVGKFAFNSSDCYLEKQIQKARHIEVQFLADHHGNTVTVGERECSVQRRYQKVIEESPSPVISEEDRQRLSKMTIKLVNALGYHNAGTLEFIREENGQFYFMEINARLQVEHGVTEMVTGIDIVKQQIAIASGEPLRIRQADIHLNGHAIEARIYAEDPKTLIPSPGRITHLNLPEENSFLRIDHALETGMEITPYYDPMVAKVIVWAETRAGAIERMEDALSRLEIEGIQTNIETNLFIINREEFLKAKIHTHTLEKLISL